MSFIGHVRKREAKSGLTTYQIIVEEESEYTGGKRKRHYKTIKGIKKDAEKAMRQMITELENRTFTKDSKITVADFMNQWIELYIKNQLSPTTVQHYVDQTNNYIIPQFGDMYLQQLKNIDIQKLVFSLAQERLSYANYQITMDIYSHVLKSVEKEATDKIDNALFSSHAA